MKIEAGKTYLNRDGDEVAEVCDPSSNLELELKVGGVVISCFEHPSDNTLQKLARCTGQTVT